MMEYVIETVVIKRHSKYKDSGVQWLGSIPAHWQVVRSKRLFRERKERARNSDEQLTASQKYGIINQQEFMELEDRRVTQVEFNRGILKHVEANDFVISMRSFQGGIEYSKFSGCISSAYIPLVPIKDVVPTFFKYLFKSHQYIAALSSTSNLVRDGQAMRFENFSLVDLLIVPKDEQAAIACFLDRKTAQIDKAIDQKEKLIELLKERRQILIHNAVTKGLNPNVKMRDSGVGWIGEIPEHWESLRLKHLARIRSGDFVSNVDLSDDGQYEVYGGNGFMGCTDRYNSEGERIIIGRVGAYCGNVRYINTKKWISDNALILTLNAGESYKYVSIFLQAADLNNLNVSNAQPLITGGKVLNSSIVIPGSREQEQIYRYIDNVKVKTETAIHYKQKEIQTLAEYKSTLINSAVTGKIKVPDLGSMD